MNKLKYPQGLAEAIAARNPQDDADFVRKIMTPTPPNSIEKIADDSLTEFYKQVTDSAPLIDRLKEARERIGKMCSERRGPRMSIPAQWYDDDVFICKTIEDAIDALPSLAELERDAARYRWWRENAWFYRGVNCLQYGWPRCGEIGIKDGADKNDTIDAAIDAARAKEAPR